jgi:peptide/nickel transport system ATP-binding protein
MNSDSILQVENLSTQLGDSVQPVTAVNDVSFELQRGKTFVLVGESGCGKSMIALSLMRLLPPSGRIVGGEVRLNETSLLDLSEEAMRKQRGGGIGMIFQEPMTSLNPVMRVGDQVLEAVKLHDPGSVSAMNVRVVELFRSVGIPEPERRVSEYPHQLSGGMKQRVMIAMALAGRPEVLIADEPTTALDVTIQAQVLEVLRDVQRQTGMAILMITHDLGVVAEMADEVGVMYAGQLIERASVKDFFASPKHPYSQKLFRSLPSNDKRTESLEIIPGIVPALNQHFVGCRFAERCALREPRCDNELPAWQGDASTGYRCHLVGDTQLPVSSAQIDAPRVENAAAALVDIRQLQVHFPIRKGVLRRTVGYVKAVDGVDLSIKKGSTVALVGESGCGKTTVGKALLQLLDVAEGEVNFDGHDLMSLSGETLRKLRREFQIIFQDPASSMNPRMLVEDIVAEGLIAQNIEPDRPARRQRVIELLNQVGLPESALLRYPHEFSGGQRQRIAIARALAVSPKFIVCDEPTSALDVSVQAQVLNLLKQLQRDLSLSYLFITHNISVVAYLADEVAVMYLGRIVEYGSVQQVLQAPQHPYTQALLTAVPVADPSRERNVIRLEGDLPSPSNPPAGCHFHERCPLADTKCRERYPVTVDLGEGHKAACWRLNDHE